MKQKNYRLDVKCSNCGEKQIIEIPIGLEWHDECFGNASHYGEYDTYHVVACFNCGCEKLNRIITQGGKKDGK